MPFWECAFQRFLICHARLLRYHKMVDCGDAPELLLSVLFLRNFVE
jgi:hypothetical protein